jgi:hypothetical protein
VATAVGSGEYVIWPFIASNIGLTVLWAAVVAVAIRITADAVKINAAPKNEFWSESRIYAATVWTLIVVGVAILLIFTEQPLLLLVIASALSAIVMFIYSILLIVMDRGVLPTAIRLGGFRLAVLCVAVVWFGSSTAASSSERHGPDAAPAGSVGGLHLARPDRAREARRCSLTSPSTRVLRRVRGSYLVSSGALPSRRRGEEWLDPRTRTNNCCAASAGSRNGR